MKKLSFVKLFKINANMNNPNPHFPVDILLNNSLQLFENLCDRYQLQYNFEKGLSKRLKIICTDDYIDDSAKIEEHFNEDDNIELSIILDLQPSELEVYEISQL